ncbi:Peptidoglycan-associated lipoprotein [Dyadobacter sp. CECT 9275]|uniref:Peptidoglycan-associated lipoprotein n=1 Tax=Dyadobacter helix TaxID=2822344 RepID=A0A916J9F7_9BACT|nr:OmpA family protein [Dyadobacter sp. CECT 9275]CAG4992000.1 Peptidoglycan-associated lipoprotein [Dyadobacter sp. CECT 9275]
MEKNKALLWTLLIFWIAGSTYWHVCHIRQLCDAQLLPSFGLSTPGYTDSSLPSPPATGHSKKRFFTENDFIFRLSDASPTDYTSAHFLIDSLKQILISNPDKKLEITGKYLPMERNDDSSFSNLGLARAATVKKLFLTNGIADSLLAISGIEKDTLAVSGDSLRGAISFRIKKRLLLTEKDLAEDQKFESIFKPIDLYFPYASADYIKTKENETFLMEAKKYLGSHAGQKLILTGHTDNEDSAEWNMQLSKKRAYSVKMKLMAMGMDGSQIIARGKGETEPKLPNNTIQGKRANRRVTLVVQ